MNLSLCIGGYSIHCAMVCPTSHPFRTVSQRAYSVSDDTHSFLTIRVWRRRFPFFYMASPYIQPPIVSGRNIYLTSICVSSDRHLLPNR